MPTESLAHEVHIVTKNHRQLLKMAMDGLCTLGISVESSSSSATMESFRVAVWCRQVDKFAHHHVQLQENSPDVFCRRGGQEPVGLDVVGDAEWNCWLLLLVEKGGRETQITSVPGWSSIYYCPDNLCTKPLDCQLLNIYKCCARIQVSTVCGALNL